MRKEKRAYGLIPSLMGTLFDVTFGGEFIIIAVFECLNTLTDGHPLRTLVTRKKGTNLLLLSQYPH